MYKRHRRAQLTKSTVRCVSRYYSRDHETNSNKQVLKVTVKLLHIITYTYTYNSQENESLYI